ncbi:MAG: pre-mRNA processing RNA-helicase [Watsoniomyces obsoletus]|nr:MAG: pre-mRNA processing RNA-helicase [Watsoniomyces obsoletus]
MDGHVPRTMTDLTVALKRASTRKRRKVIKTPSSLDRVGRRSLTRLSVDPISPGTLADFVPALGLSSQLDPSHTARRTAKRAASVCSDTCSQKDCGPACDDERCQEECLPACYGFIDCDDADVCTRPDCGETECRHQAPPCFDMNCLQPWSEEEVEAAAQLAGTSVLRPGYLSTAAPPGSSHHGDFNHHQTPFHSFPSTHHFSHTDFMYPPFMPEGSSLAAAQTAPLPMTSPPNTGYQMDHHHHSGSHDGMLNTSHVESNTQTALDQQNNSSFYCQWGGGCTGPFFDWTALDEHIYHDHVKPQNEVQCRWNDCQQATNPNELVSHVLQNHHPSGLPQTCLWSDCMLTVPDPDALASHVRSVHLPANPLHCHWDSCGVAAPDAEGLSLHLQTDHFPDPWALPLPEESRVSATPSASSMTCRWWMAAHGDGSESKDEDGHECGVACADAGALQKHLKEGHIGCLNKKEGYVCQWADCARRGIQPFGQKGKLERHVQVHTGYKCCRCDVCHQDFSSPLALKQHERRHTGEKPYKCDVCGRQFAQGTALTMHKRTHTKEKPLKCDFPNCNKTFSESSTLSKHKKTHSLAGQYVCEYPTCQSSFHRLDQRKRHYLLVHGGPPEGLAAPQPKQELQQR